MRGHRFLRCLLLVALLLHGAAGFAEDDGGSPIEYGVTKTVDVHERTRDNSVKRIETYAYRSPSCTLTADLVFWDRNPPPNRLDEPAPTYFWFDAGECRSPHVERMSAAVLLLAQMKQDGRLDTIETIGWPGQLYESPTLVLRTAKLALASPSWVELMRRDNQEIWKYANGEMLKILREEAVFRELVMGVSALGYRLEVKSLEKPFATLVNRIEALSGLGLPENALVPYHVQIYLSLEELQ